MVAASNEAKAVFDITFIYVVGLTVGLVVWAAGLVVERRRRKR